ncbi:hypothetical protein LINPERHAP1_LOCUS16003, partial [Linum perenne]
MFEKGTCDTNKWIESKRCVLPERLDQRVEKLLECLCRCLILASQRKHAKSMYHMTPQLQGQWWVSSYIRYIDQPMMLDNVSIPNACSLLIRSCQEIHDERYDQVADEDHQQLVHASSESHKCVLWPCKNSSNTLVKWSLP